jgi:hypothetical protein
MKTFNVHLTGLWNFDFLVDAKSKEEAIGEAIEVMELEAAPIDLCHVDQYAEEDNGQKILDGPGPGDMKISDEFFPKIIAAKYEDSHDNETSD